MKTRAILIIIALTCSFLAHADTISIAPTGIIDNVTDSVMFTDSTKIVRDLIASSIIGLGRTIPGMYVDDVIRYGSSLKHSFKTAGYVNPAVNESLLGNQITQINAGWELDEQNKAFIAQQGDGYHKLNITTQSHIRKQKYTVWGKAYYKQAKRENVQWNENADYHIVYPYVIADSVGGDINNEEYYFSGGYARNFGKLRLAVYADYRASLEYRKVDPRPRNTVGDLNIRAGASYNFDFAYIGGSFLYRKYKQSGGISHYNPEGRVPYYHLTGMGMMYTGLGSGEANTHFNGNDFGGSIEFRKYERNFSLTGMATYNSFSIDKVINDINDFPLNHIKDNKLYSEIVFMLKNNYGAKIQFTHKNRKGTERLPGDPENGVYPILVSAQQYDHQHTNMAFSLIYSNMDAYYISERQIQWSAQPKVGYTNMEFKYKNPLNKMAVSTINAGISLEAHKRIMDRSVLALGFDFTHNQNTESSITLNNNGSNSLNAVVMSNYNILASSGQQYNVLLNYQYTIKKSVLSLKTQWAHYKLSNNLNRDFYQISLGYNF